MASIDRGNPYFSAPLKTPSESGIQDNKALTCLIELDAATMTFNQVVSADVLLDANVFEMGAMGQARG